VCCAGILGRKRACLPGQTAAYLSRASRAAAALSHAAAGSAAKAKRVLRAHPKATPKTLSSRICSSLFLSVVEPKESLNLRVEENKPRTTKSFINLNLP